MSAWNPMSEGRPAYLLGVLLYFPSIRAMAVGCLDVDDRWCVGGNAVSEDQIPSHWHPLPPNPPHAKGTTQP